MSEPQVYDILLHVKDYGAVREGAPADLTPRTHACLVSFPLGFEPLTVVVYGEDDPGAAYEAVKEWVKEHQPAWATAEQWEQFDTTADSRRLRSKRPFWLVGRLCPSGTSGGSWFMLKLGGLLRAEMSLALSRLRSLNSEMDSRQVEIMFPVETFSTFDSLPDTPVEGLEDFLQELDDSGIALYPEDRRIDALRSVVEFGPPVRKAGLLLRLNSTRFVCSPHHESHVTLTSAINITDYIL